MGGGARPSPRPPLRLGDRDAEEWNGQRRPGPAPTDPRPTLDPHPPLSLQNQVVGWYLVATGSTDGNAPATEAWTPGDAEAAFQAALVEAPAAPARSPMGFGCGGPPVPPPESLDTAGHAAAAAAADAAAADVGGADPVPRFGARPCCLLAFDPSPPPNSRGLPARLWTAAALAVGPALRGATWRSRRVELVSTPAERAAVAAAVEASPLPAPFVPMAARGRAGDWRAVLSAGSTGAAGEPTTGAEATTTPAASGRGPAVRADNVILAEAIDADAPPRPDAPTRADAAAAPPAAGHPGPPPDPACPGARLAAELGQQASALRELADRLGAVAAWCERGAAGAGFDPASASASADWSTLRAAAHLAARADPALRTGPEALSCDPELRDAVRAEAEAAVDGLVPALLAATGDTVAAGLSLATAAKAAAAERASAASRGGDGLGREGRDRRRGGGGGGGGAGGGRATRARSGGRRGGGSRGRSRGAAPTAVALVGGP